LKAGSVCAWCPDFVAPTVPGVSHGMCQACSDRLIFEAMKRIEFHAFVIDQRTGPRLDAMLADNEATDAAILAEREEAERDEDCGSKCGRACGHCGRCS